MKKIILFILFCHVFQGCDKDPISGLERGWVWDALGIEEDDGIGEIKFDLGTGDAHIRLFKGVGTGGVAVLDTIFSSNTLYIKEFPSGKYTVTKNSDGEIIDSEDFKLKHCAKVYSPYGNGNLISVGTVENGWILECW